MTQGRSASTIVSDDFYYAIGGKVSLSGVYIQDLVVPVPGAMINQLVFFFSIETPKERPFQSITLKIQLPNQELKFTPIPILPRVKSDPLRKKIIIRQPILIQQISLYPGKIQTSVLHEEGETDAGGIWIVLTESAPLQNTQPEI